ncbi:MAG: class I SAM-dependent methyltransferase [Geminicoccaceae bacterium]
MEGTNENRPDPSGSLGGRLADLADRSEIVVILRLAQRLQRGSLEIALPDGERRQFVGSEPGPHGVLRLRNGHVGRRYLTAGSVGFAEGYIEGDWDTPDLASLLAVLNLNEEAWGDSYFGGLWHRVVRRMQHTLRPNTRHGSRRNIHAHYDLGNEFFAAWLDPSMTYSSALFAEDGEDLEAAQRAKYRNLAREIAVGPGQRLLEIGSGWGGFAVTAAKEFGAKVTSITVSRAQAEYARARVFREGLAEQVEIVLQDYRDVKGRFDRIASIEMFEAVGERFWPTYFRTLRERLAPDGAAGLQLITIADRYFEAYRRNVDFIQAYIFPGGMLPSPAALDRQAGQAGLTRTSELGFGLSYARTLALWNERFQAAWPKVRELGFDERFRRIWTYYLAYCEAGFRTGSIDVVQTVLRPA